MPLCTENLPREPDIIFDLIFEACDIREGLFAPDPVDKINPYIFTQKVTTKIQQVHLVTHLRITECRVLSYIGDTVIDRVLQSDSHRVHSFPGSNLNRCCDICGRHMQNLLSPPFPLYHGPLY